MATNAITGAISGYDTESIVEALLSYDQAKIDLVQDKIDDYEVKMTCYEEIDSLLQTLTSAADSLSDTDLWDAYSVTSSDESSLSASATEYATAGTYSFIVKQLAQATQYMSTGFADNDTTAVSSVSTSEIRIDSTKSSVAADTELSSLNGGAGVAQGGIRITDKSGDSAVIDLTGLDTLQDVIDAINDSGLGVTASIATNANGTSQGCSLTITDTTGGSGTLKIANYGSATTATDLGIVGTDSSTSGYVTGSNIYYLSNSTTLASLHDGLGVEGGTILINDGTDSWTVDLSEVTNLRGVISAIDEATGGSVTAEISSDGMSLVVTGSSGSSLTISSVNGCTTAEGLGIACTSAGETVTGSKLLADANSVQIASLSGVNGTGVNGALSDYEAVLGTFTADVGGTTVTFDLSSLSGDDSLADAIGLLNAQAETQLGSDKLVFSVNSAGNGIQVVNSTGSTVTFTDSSGTTAADLGLTASTVEIGGTMNCGDLDKNYISRATALEDLNGGAGVAEGSIIVTDASGQSASIDLSDAVTVGDVIDLINNAGLDVTASVNSTGDGILIQESTGSTATGNIKVKEVDSTTAADLGILGTGTDNGSGLSTLDGSFESVIEIDTDDTLTDVMNKITDQTDLDVSIIYDGSTYRLVVGSTETGAANDFILETDLDALSFNKITEGQDSILLYGGNSDGSGSIMLKSPSNTNNTAIQGLTLNLTATSDEQVTITVAQDTDSIVTAFSSFVDAYNSLVQLVGQLDTYVSPDDQENMDEDDITGLLYNDSSTRSMMKEIREYIYTYSEDSGIVTSLFDLGISLDDDDSSLLALDTETLTEYLESYYDDVKSFMCNTEDAASSDAGAIATSSSNGTSGHTVDNLIDDSNTTYYEASSTIENGGDTVTVYFDEATLLDYVVLYHVDTSTMAAEDYAISDFTVEYQDAKTGKWVTARTVTGNTSSSTVIGLADVTSVSAIRVTASSTNASDGVMRLADIKCTTYSGMAAELDSVLNSYADDDGGYYATLDESVSAKVDELNDDIDDLTDRMDAKEERLYVKYAAMETALSELQSTGDYLTSMFSSDSSDS